MQVVFWAIISIWAVLGIDFAVKEFIKSKLNKTPSVILYNYENENEIEYDLRCIMYTYPDSEIYVIKKNDISAPVLKKMAECYSNIHIREPDN